MALTATNDSLIQTSYNLTDDRRYATLFTTGNGYMGVRGSFEEDCDLGTQGMYVRGYIDKTIEMCQPYYPNAFIKKNYYDDDGLKAWQDTECCINAADILTVYIEVDGKRFGMLDGIVQSFERKLIYEDGVLHRSIIWDNGDGALTELIFERFASFSCDHVYCQRVTVRPLNHSLPISIYGGVDLRTKTMMQIVTSTRKKRVTSTGVQLQISSGEKYGFLQNIVQRISLVADGKKVRGEACDGKIPLVHFSVEKAQELVLEKITFIKISRDEDEITSECIKNTTYKQEYEKHIAEYKPIFDIANVEIEGNDRLDGLVRFSVYHTLISGCRNDGIHGVSAKGLTGEHYHQFVWWDSEIYQMPFFLYTHPQTAKNTLVYRHRTLQAAKNNARKQGYRGARFAFCSSVSGDECVWSFVKHPFMQDHVVSDVMFATLRCLDATEDESFFVDYGADLLVEGALYWISRVTETERGYEILHVTGTDEHHGDVNNDAYTNYCVSYVLGRILELLRGDKRVILMQRGLTDKDCECIEEIYKRLYLPRNEYGYIPQFDGYFDLFDRMEESKDLVGLQMRYCGSYDQSQIIKQPDVMLLFGYADVGLNKKYYQQNFDYYEKMCEMSSSLSYAPHAVCAADLGRMRSFLSYLEKTVSIDLENLHGGVEEGVHAGCEAGGYLSILYGAFGARIRADALYLAPKHVPGVSCLRQKLYYKNSLICLEIYGTICKIIKIKGNSVQVCVRGQYYSLQDTLTVEVE